MIRRHFLELLGGITIFAFTPTTTDTQTNYRTRAVDRQWVREAVQNTTAPGNTIINTDGEFQILQADDLQRLYAAYKDTDWTPTQADYQPDVLDCEEYAMAFRTYAATQNVNGIALVVDLESEHAYTLAVLDDPAGGLTTAVVDPTNDTIKRGAPTEFYTLGHGYTYL